MSYKQDNERAKRGWRGPRIRYDLIQEGLIALVVLAVLVVSLSVLFGSPKVDAVTYQSWAKAAPDDFVSTTLAELTGTSDSATYGPPYTNNTDAAQAIGPFSPQTWFGVHTPVNPTQAFVIAPLTAWAPLSKDIQQALQQWQSASVDQQGAWGAAALASDIAIQGTTVTLTPTPESSASPGGSTTPASPMPAASPVPAASADAGPIPTMLSVMLAAAQSGALDSQQASAPGSQYSTDYTRSLLNVADSGYLASVAEYYNLLGDQWGVMNQIGNWPGQPWLWWFTMWYRVPNPILAGLDYSDLGVIAFAIPLLAIVFFLPFIPGLRNLPKGLRVYKLIWRSYYRRYGDSEKRPAS